MTHDRGNRQDLRVQRTRRLILKALIELTIQKGFSNVTVRDITENAGINRATFYRHYQDKFDLLDQYAQAVYHLPDAPVKEGPLMIVGKSPPNRTFGLVRMFEHIRANADFYCGMLGKNGDPAFSEKVRKYIEKRFRESLPEAKIRSQTFAVFCNYVSSGSIGLLLWWLEHGMQYTPEEMARLSQRLVTASLSAIEDMGAG